MLPSREPVAIWIVSALDAPEEGCAMCKAVTVILCAKGKEALLDPDAVLIPLAVVGVFAPEAVVDGCICNSNGGCDGCCKFQPCTIPTVTLAAGMARHMASNPQKRYI